MEIVLGILVSCAMELFKKISVKFGKTLTEGIILGGLFLLIMAGTIVTQSHLVSEQSVAFIVKVFSVSITTYELVIKNAYAIYKQFSNPTIIS